MDLPAHDATEAAVHVLTGTVAASLDGGDWLPLVLNHVSEISMPGPDGTMAWRNQADGYFE